jgi:hypothetical protein
MKNKQYLLFAITGVLYLWHINSLPYAIMIGAGHDDGWFIRRAMNLLDGDWFGPYNQMTLIKGPVYPFFLALTSATGSSLQFSTAVMHLIAACAVIYSLSGYLQSFLSKYSLLILLLIVQFPLQRVIRDELSLALLLLIFSLTVIIFFNERTLYKGTFSAVLGVLLGLFMLTREDGGLTAIPVLLFAASLSIIKYFSRENSNKIIISLIILIFSTVFINVTYKTVNYFKYKSYIGVELLDSDYSNTLSAIYSVREFEAQRYVEVTNANLNAIYQISPTFHTLKTVIETTPWRDSGCAIDISTCGQFGTGYFMWALRDAMFLKGYYDTAKTAKINYRKITSDIREACETGKIKCANKYFSKVPGYELFDFKELMSIISKGIKTTLYIRIASNAAFKEGVVDSEKSAAFLNITHYILPEVNVKFYKVNGWYYDKSNPRGWFDAKISNQHPSVSTTLEKQSVKPTYENISINNGSVYIERLPSPDIAEAFHDGEAKMQRFVLYVPCSETHCVLFVNNMEVGDLRGKIESKDYKVGGILYVDTIYDTSKIVQNRTLEDQKVSTINRYNFIANYYNRCSKTLFIGGIISILILILRGLRQRNLETPVLVLIVLWFIYIWRIIFLSLVTFFWIPNGINHLYLYSSIVIMPIASFMSIYLLINTYWKYLVTAVKN